MAKSGGWLGHCIIAKKVGSWDPGPFSTQIRKVEARLGKLAKIRKVEIN